MNSLTQKLISLVNVALVVVIVICTSANAKDKKSEGGWKNLFDGKTLDSWAVRGGFAKYRAENGEIVGTSVEGSPNTFLCTKKQYGDFFLEFEVKCDPRLNSGVQIRSHIYNKDTTQEMWRRGQKRKVVRKAGHVYGYQVEITNERTGSSGGIYDEARKGMWLYDVKSNPAAKGAFKDNQWNKYRVACIGDSIKTWVNGVPCSDLRDPIDQVGFIGLQVHSVRSDTTLEVRWRNIRINDLGRHVWKPLFDGKTLKGWHTLPGGKWEVIDGAIVGTSASSESRHGLLVSDKSFGDFSIRLKFKALKGNSGFYFRADEVGSGVGVHGFQAEIDASNDVGGLYETGGRAWVVQPSAEEVATWFRPQEWNEMAVSAHGRRVAVHVNGRKTAELKNDKGRLKGLLALQLHGGQEMHVMFKDIEILLAKKKRKSLP
ncbi:MAG: 3-keto-disaccharide hydrolase [Planctomycetota bacterium]